MNKQTIARTARVSHVISTLMMEGLSVPLARMKVTHCATLACRLHCTWARLMGRKVSPHPWPIAVRDALIKLGPAFVKIGQVLSVRSDLVPASLAEALHSLQSAVPPVPLDQIEFTIEQSLGRPSKDIFARFDATPLAAGSIAQVHRAALADGTEVVIKVKRPGIDAIVREDLEILVWLAQQIERTVPESRRYRPMSAAAELRNYTLRELDFRIEAGVASEVGAQFQSWPKVAVPTVFQATRDVMVMAYVEGFQIDDLEALDRHGIDRKVLMRLGTNATLAQIFDFGLFHGDPHPGNLHVTPEGDLALLDFGIFGRIDRRLRRDCAMLMWCLSEGDAELAATFLLRMATLDPGATVPAFRREVEACYRAWHGNSVGEYGFAKLLYQELTLGARHGVVFPSEMVLLGKAMVTIEGVALAVDSELDISEVARPYLDSLRSQLFDPAELKKAMVRAFPLWWSLAERLPIALAQVLDQTLVTEQPLPAVPRKRTRLRALAALVALAGIVLLAVGLRPWAGDAAALGGALLLASVVLAAYSSRR
ncbi:MAG: AarF/ABC1/UbiB kinase family protein [Oligoflexia bacterium]|nr:AarF/ABC1/UbiB kinase family protein [Oligoflexia bacterium]